MAFSKDERKAIILNKLRKSMAKDGLDALVAFRPENIYYSSGSKSRFSVDMGAAGIAVTVIPKDEDKDPAAILSDFEFPTFAENSWITDIRLYPMWVFVDDTYGKGPSTSDQEKGEQFGLEESFRQLGAILAEKGLERGRIGVEKSFIQVPSWELMKKHLPHADLIDSDMTWIDSRTIKMPWEIEYLRTASQVTEKGLAKAISIIQEGTTTDEIYRAYGTEVFSDSRVTGLKHIMVNVGTNFGPVGFVRQDPVKPGDVIEFDVGADCWGYLSDMARTFSLGEPNERLSKIFPILYKGYLKALDLVKPGTRMCDIFKVGMTYIQDNGMPHYNRGHLGHHIGLDMKIEEPPFLSPSETKPLEPGNVICLETPYYGYGVGAISIEDVIHVTEDGYELLTKSTKELVKL